MLHTSHRFLLLGLVLMTTATDPSRADEPAENPSPTGRPNILFVITDDQGYGDLGCTGNSVVKTPHLDAFHDDALRLTNFHVGPTCAPTRAGLLTGRYAGSTGVWHTIGGRSIVREGQWMLPEALRAAGYRTAMFGKWHLGDNYPYRPEDRGFERVINHPGGGIGQQPDHWGNDYFDDTYLVDGKPRAFDGYCTDVWFNEAASFIENHVAESPDQPFFCYLAPNAPHSPYNVPTRYFEKYEGKVPPHVARFYGMIDNLDENFGRIRETLQELGIEDNTLVVFMTDNGSSCPMTNQEGFPEPGFNAGLRGGKGSPYDGGHRVPVFIRWPNGNVGGGQDIDTLTANIDVMPTLLDLCGIPRESEYDFHGRSLGPLFTDHAKDWPRRSVVTESQRVLVPIKWRKSCVMTDRWRLIQGKELYDITTDRGQARDVAAQHPEVVTRLRGEYETWWSKVYHDADLPIPLPLGDPDGPDVVRLNSHDWRFPEAQGDVPWNQGQVRQGVQLVGYWEVDVRRPGRYRIELQRWPKDADEALNAPDEPEHRATRFNEAETDPNYRHWYEDAHTIQIREAHLTIGPRRHRQAFPALATNATFETDLPKGLAHLSARFRTDAGEYLGAYYVYVRRLEDTNSP